MFKLQFENSRGQVIELFDYPYRLYKVEGMGDVGADIQTQRSPYQDGVSLIDVTLEPRYINIELKIYGDDGAETEKNRRFISSVFNPRLGEGALRYIRGEEVKEINAVAESVPNFPDGSNNRKSTFQRTIIFLKCPNPYWKSTEITEEPAFEGLFEFPSDEYWEEGEDGDLYFEVGIQRTDRIIYNDGDAPAPIQVNFYGPADSPMIENRTTGEFIRIKKRLEEGEVLKIDTTDGIKSLIYVDEEGNESNVFNWIDTGSTFFKLQIGENDITCNCAISNNIKDFDIFYSKLYNAV